MNLLDEIYVSIFLKLINNHIFSLLITLITFNDQKTLNDYN